MALPRVLSFLFIAQKFFDSINGMEIRLILTTLRVIISKQYRYNIIEIRISDRNISSLTARGIKRLLFRLFCRPSFNRLSSLIGFQREFDRIKLFDRRREISFHQMYATNERTNERTTGKLLIRDQIAGNPFTRLKGQFIEN